MTPLDLVCSAIVLTLLVRGAVRGFVAEFLSMAAIVLGTAAAVLFSDRVAGVIEDFFGPSLWSGIIAFLAVFLTTYLVVKLLEGLLQRGLERLSLRRLDRAFGLLLGAAEGVLVVAAGLIILSVQPFFDAQPLLVGSYYVRLLIPLVGAAGLTEAMDL